MREMVIIKPKCMDETKTRRLEKVMEEALAGFDITVSRTIETATEFEKADLTSCRILFAIALGESGINLEYYEMLKQIRISAGEGIGKGKFAGSVAGILVDGNSELYTKDIARQLVFTANMAGCAFPGRPLVEGTATLFNFNIIAKNLGTDMEGAYRASVRQLVERIVDFDPPLREKPKLLALHAGNAATSNTLELWHMVREKLDVHVTELSLRDGEVWDCRGCSYETCLHMGEQGSCVYGGVITHTVYPNILQCDGLVMVCPNYNDAISANLTAFVNRLTAIFRVHRFFDKRLYAIIVSGYSGSDIVAQQLISGLNMNKTFLLPPGFALMKTANDPRTINRLPGIHREAEKFAAGMMAEFHRETITLPG